MNKVFLLGALVCAGQMYGMEPLYPEEGRYIFGKYMPTEIKALIISYLNEYDNLDNVIRAIKATSLTNQELYKIVNDKYGNQKGFTELVHILAIKYPDKPVWGNSTMVAYQFKTPAAKQYVDLSQKLESAVKKGTLDEVAKLINEGADVNSGSSGCGYGVGDIYIKYDNPTALDVAVMFLRPKIVELLLKAGAVPKSYSYYDEHGFVPFCYLREEDEKNADKNKEEIKELLDNAMKKYQR